MKKKKRLLKKKKMMRALDSDRVQSAALNAAFNLVSAMAIFVVYMNYLMLSEYLPPLMLAALLAVLLRGPRDAIVGWGVMERLRMVEEKASVGVDVGGVEMARLSGVMGGAVFGPLRVMAWKLVLLWRLLVDPWLQSRRGRVGGALILAAWTIVLVWSLNTSVWWFVFAIAPLVIAFGCVVTLVLIPVNTLVALTIVVIFLCLVVLTGGVFATQVVVETADFSYAMAARVQETLGDEAYYQSLLLPWMQKINPSASASASASTSSIDKGGGPGPGGGGGTFESFASTDRLLHLARLISTSRKLLNSANDTSGFKKAVRDLQRILNFDEELYRSITNVDVGQLIAHPLETSGKLLWNSAIVMRALWDATAKFGAQLSWTLMSIFFSFFNYTFSGLIFLAALFYLIQSEKLWIDQLLESTTNRTVYRRVIVSYLRGIFLASFASFVLNALCTGIVFWLFAGVTSFFYTSMLLAGLCGVFPIIPVWAVFLIPSTHKFFIGEVLMSSWLMMCGFAIHFFAAPLVYHLVPYSHSWVTGMSIFLGLIAFGLEGILIGPLLVASVLILWSIFMGTALSDLEVHGPLTQKWQ